MDFFPFCEFVAAYDVRRFLTELAVHVRRMRSISPADHLSSFLGCEADTCDQAADRIEHVAVYAGDYRRDEDFEAWLDCLLQEGTLSNPQVGPSYIAPREYGTQGYWISAELEGAGLEIFAIKRAGSWQAFPPLKKAARMSHVGLGVNSGSQVLPLLTRLAGCPHISLLSYSPDDELNHTYGHLLNRKTDRVLEIVHVDRSRDLLSHDSLVLDRVMEGAYGGI